MNDDDQIDGMVELVRDKQADAYRRGLLSMWTVYDRPRDYPNAVVARCSEIDKGKVTMTDHLLCAEGQNALGVVRTVMLRGGLTRLDRMAGDDPRIVEVWL